MSPMWGAAGTLVVVAALLVAWIAHRVAAELDELTRRVRDLRALRVEVVAPERPAPREGWGSAPIARR